MRKGSWFLQNKELIRTSINDKRRAVSDSERNIAAQAALQHFLQSELFSAGHNIACYLARNEEFDCSPIIQAIWQAKKNCYLPTLSPSNDGHLDFVSYHATDELHLNRYRILEPERNEIFPAQNLDLVLMPLVGFDMQGNRLGAGGGYYDRSFEFLRNQTKRKPLLIGLAYEFQQLYQMPVDEWDVKMDGVMTEKGITLF